MPYLFELYDDLCDWFKMHLICLLKTDINKSQNAINQITNKHQNTMSKLHMYYLAINYILSNKLDKKTKNHASDLYVVLIIDF